MQAPRWVDDSAALDDLVAEVAEAPAYALDTEFHGERSYYPQLALVQVAWPDGIALVDPLAVDPAPLKQVLAGAGVMVVHAGDQDLAILERACGIVPARYFDTQVAAGFVGMRTPSLAMLAERLLRVRLAKGDRLTDWTRRPLSADQRSYAAADVAHLLPIADKLLAKLDAAGRRQWALDECEERRRRDRARPDPELAWWRMKGSRQLRGKSRGVAQKVAAWRERTAERLDQPPRFVLPDLALAGIVQRPPQSRDELAAVRGLDGRHLRAGAAAQILAAVQEGVDLPPEELRVPDVEPSDRALSPAVALIAAWLNERADELDLDPAVLGTRADIVELLNGGRGRLTEGWRADLVGEPIRALLAGDACVILADGGRRLELRSVPSPEPARGGVTPFGTIGAPAGEEGDRR